MRQIIMMLVWILVIAGGLTTPGHGKTHAPASPIHAFNATIAKWYHNHTAAISLTYDDGDFASKNNRRINKFVIQNGVTLDYEIVTADFLKSSYGRTLLKEEFIPLGLGYFGHGHTHIPHDSLSYEEALKSFTLCFETMKSLGLKPVAYAYPNGAAKKNTTRHALAASGFLSGRLHFSKAMTEPYIVPDAKVEPEDWFALPCLVMQDYSFNHCDRCVSNNEQLLPYLDATIAKKAWIILTYHAIGDEKGYGFFKYEEFQKNIYDIKKRDFWVASMNAITLYLREYAQAQVYMIAIPESKNKHKNKIKEIQIMVSDGLPNLTFDHPLTVLFDLPKSWVNKSLVLSEEGKIISTLFFSSSKATLSILPDEINKKIMVKK